MNEAGLVVDAPDWASTGSDGEEDMCPSASTPSLSVQESWGP